MITVLVVLLISGCCLADIPIPQECKETYQCFFPGSCDSGEKPHTVVEWGARSQVRDDCEAIIKIHKLSDHQVLIKMESFNSDVSKITLIQQGETVLSCEKQSNGVVDISTPHRKDVETSTAIESDKNLRCNAGLKNRHKVILPSAEFRKVNISSAGIETSFSSMLLINTRCDPSRIRFVAEENDVKNDKIYAPVKYSPMSAYCERRGFFRTMEYRKGLDDAYKTISSLTCTSTEDGFYFTIDGEPKKEGGDLVVRCAADAAFFCDYDPKSKQGETALIRTNAVESTSSPSKLECPPSYQYLIVNNKKPKRDITMSCQIYGGRMAYWTTSEGQILARTGPEVYCANKMSCERIPTKNVKLGQLVNSGLKPKCFEKGNLTISDDSGTFAYEEDYEFKCDETSGKLTFLGNRVATIVTEKTIFTCTYPKREVLISKGATLGVMGLAIVLAIAGFSLFAFISVPAIGRCIYERAQKKNKMNALKKAMAEYKVVMRKEKSGNAKQDSENEEKEEKDNDLTNKEIRKVSTGSSKKDASTDSDKKKEVAGDSTKDEPGKTGESTKKEGEPGDSEKNASTKKGVSGESSKEQSAREGFAKNTRKKEKPSPATEHVTKVNQASRKLVKIKTGKVVSWGPEEASWTLTPADFVDESFELNKLKERKFANSRDLIRVRITEGHDDFQALYDFQVYDAKADPLEKKGAN